MNRAANRILTTSFRAEANAEARFASREINLRLGVCRSENIPLPLLTLLGMDASGPDFAEDATPMIRSSVVAAGLVSLQVSQYKQLNDYLSLILRWNSKINLTSVREPAGMISRHLVESIACAQALPSGIATLLDYGSGPGLPGIPIAICRQEIAVTLAESQSKKAAFLREAVRATAIAVRVHPGRAEHIQTLFDCVAMRAVDRMDRAVGSAASLIVPGGWLAVMTSFSSLQSVQAAASMDLEWSTLSLPGGEQRVLALARRSA
jgi:16S rRNA (guanine527-N7)-methyltransferase